MIPRTPSHEKLTRWLAETDPILASRKESYDMAGVVYEVEQNGDLCMIYAHEADGSCCTITNRNQGLPYSRSPQGGFIRGRE